MPLPPSLPLPRPGPAKKGPIRHEYSPPKKVRRIKRTYSKRRKIQVLLFLENHRIPVLEGQGDDATQVSGGFRRPYLKEAMVYFGIKSISTIQYWWSQKEALFGERIPRYRPHWPELEVRLKAEFLDARRARRLIHRNWFKRRAKVLFKDLYLRCPDIFVFSNGWFRGFLKRSRISRRRITQASTRVPEEIVKYVNEFLQFVRRNSRNDTISSNVSDNLSSPDPGRNAILMSDPVEGTTLRRFPLHLIANLDETPMPFEFLQGYTYDIKGSRSVQGRSDRSGWGKRQATLILTILGDGSYAEELKPVIIFHGKGNVVAREGALYNTGVDVRFNETAYNNEALFEDWIRTRLAAYTAGREALLVIDVVKFHKTDAIKTALKDNNITAAMIPPGLTAYLQPLDVGFNGPFKAWLREETELYLDHLEETGQMPERWSISQRRVMTTHVVAKAWQRAFSPANQSMVANIFKATGISVHPDGREDHLISIKDVTPDQLRLDEWYRAPDVQNYDITDLAGPDTDEFMPNGETRRLSDYSTLLHKVLKEMCRQRRLRVSGCKAELIRRLEDDDATQVTQRSRDQGEDENLQEGGREAAAIEGGWDAETGEPADLVSSAIQATSRETSPSASASSERDGESASDEE